MIALNGYNDNFKKTGKETHLIKHLCKGLPVFKGHPIKCSILKHTYTFIHDLTYQTMLLKTGK